MADLEALYQQDLKLLNAIEAGLNNKIGHFRDIIAAMYVQKAWKGFVARQKAKRKAEELKAFNANLEAFTAKSAAARAYRAALVIQRAWRRFKARKNELERLKRRNEARRRQESDEKLGIEFQMRQIRAAKAIQKNWRNYKKRKAEGLLDGSSKGFLASPENPFLKNLKKRPNRFAETIGIQNYHEEKWCSICSKRVGKRQCCNCAGAVFCEACFVESHDKGSRRRHVYLRITYDKEKPEEQTGGPSSPVRSTASFSQS